jgi:hypothetical protein
MSSHAGLETFESLANTVNFSPFPMILVDRWLRVYAASMSSGFKTDQTVTDQTPSEEQAFFQQFIGQLAAAGFWEGSCQKFDYEFHVEAETRVRLSYPSRYIAKFLRLSKRLGSRSITATLILD